MTVNGSILVVNAGSSSVKFALFTVTGAEQLDAGPHGQVEGIGDSPRLTIRSAAGAPLADEPVPTADHEGAFGAIQQWFRSHMNATAIAAVGHRIVHGGSALIQPTRIDAKVLAAMEELVPLAPLHQPHNLAAVRAVMQALPDVPQVACFDTAFHRSMPHVAQTFALPRRFAELGVHRYGFHGLSYEYICSVLPAVAPAIASGRVVIAHLGNGASMCAVRDRRCVATTMGFTALDGLVMGTRCGALDPGVLLYLMDEYGLDARAIERVLYHESGLLGVSGLSSDMRVLLESDDPHAREAIDLFVYRIGRELGSLVAALGGLDALVFTAGIGENAPEVRARVCRDAAWTGLRLDDGANRAGGPRISSAAGQVSAWVVPTDENRMIAQHTRAVVEAQ